MIKETKIYLYLFHVDCGNVTDPDKGNVTYVATTYNETANYLCDTGYNIFGISTRTCQANGNWTDDAPSCNIVGWLLVQTCPYVANE